MSHLAMPDRGVLVNRVSHAIQPLPIRSARRIEHRCPVVIALVHRTGLMWVRPVGWNSAGRAVPMELVEVRSAEGSGQTVLTSPDRLPQCRTIAWTASPVTPLDCCKR